MKILMLSSTFPYPPNRGGTEIRTFNLLKYLHLTQQHQITLVTQRHATVTDAEVKQLQQWVSDLVMFPLPKDPQSQGFGGKLGRFGVSLLKGTPPNVLQRYCPEIQKFVDRAVEQKRYQVITCEHSVNEIYIRPEFALSIPTVVNVHSSVYGWTRSHLEMGASQNTLRDRLYLPLLLNYEKRYSAKFSQIVVTTEDDRRQFQEFAPHANIAVIPNGVDLDLFPYRERDPRNHRLVFTGAMDASHNIDAARFFAVEVLPLLKKHYPDVTFAIVGERPAPEVMELQNIPGVLVTGKVDSMSDELHRSSICVVPLRTGYGIKNKTLEAMAAGVPVVGSDRGLEGLTVDGPNVPLRALRANRIEEYVHQISCLFNDASLRKKLSLQGRALIEREYTWNIAGKLYEQVLGKFCLS